MDYRELFASYRPRDQREAAERAVILDCIRSFPETVLLRDNLLAHVTVSALLLNEDRSRVLLVHHNLYQSWSWTGGHADGDGDLLAVALREAREETGVRSLHPLSGELVMLNLLPVWGHQKNGRYVPSHLHLNGVFAVLADESEAVTPRPEENSGVRWFGEEELPQAVREERFPALYQEILRRARSL